MPFKAKNAIKISTPVAIAEKAITTTIVFFLLGWLWSGTKLEEDEDEDKDYLLPYLNCEIVLSFSFSSFRNFIAVRQVKTTTIASPA